MPAVRSGNTDVTVYARLPAGQDVAPGTYSDTLVVTVFL
jgi:spore coat protein U-like protein